MNRLNSLLYYGGWEKESQNVRFFSLMIVELIDLTWRVIVIILDLGDHKILLSRQAFNGRNRM